MSSHARFNQTVFSFFLAIYLLLSACQQITVPTENDLVTDLDPQPNHQIPTETIIESTEPPRTQALSEFGVLKEGFANYYAPFEVRYHLAEWAPNSESFPDTLHSTTVSNCNFRFLYGRSASWLEGPFPLQADKVAYEYLIERFPKQWENGPASVHYYFHHIPDPVNFPKQIWSFEMITNPTDESACFESVKPLLASLTIGQPESNRASILMEEQRIDTFCSYHIEGNIKVHDINSKVVVFSYIDKPGQLYMVESAQDAPKKLVDSAFKNGEIRQAFILWNTILYIDVDRDSNDQNWKMGTLSKGEPQEEIIMDSDTSSIALEYLVIHGEYIGYAQPNPDGKTYKVTVSPVQAFFLENIKSLVIEKSDYAIGSMLLSEDLLLINWKWDEDNTGLIPPAMPILAYNYRENEFLDVPIPDGHMLGFNYPVLFFERPVEGRWNEIATFNFETNETSLYKKDKSHNSYGYSFNGEFLSWFNPTCSSCTDRNFQFQDTELGSTNTLMGLYISDTIGFAKLWSHSTEFVLVDNRDSEKSINFICDFPLNTISSLNSPMQTYIKPIPELELEKGFTLRSYALEGFSSYSWKLSNKTVLYVEKNKFTHIPAEYGAATSPTQYKKYSLCDDCYIYKNPNLYAYQVETDKGKVVQVFKDDELRYEVLFDWIGHLDNLIDFDGAIYLEVYRERKPRIWFTQTGEIYRDGVSLNEKYGYDEAFGMSVLDGEISFFFKQDGRIGFRWGDVEQLLPFDEIDIDRLSILDRPYSFTKAKAFYAKSGYQWYYVVLGRFGEH